MSIQRPQTRTLPEPVLENVAAGEAHIGAGQSIAPGRKQAVPARATPNAPAADRGKFDILFACGVSVAFWGVIIFLLTALL